MLNDCGWLGGLRPRWVPRLARVPPKTGMLRRWYYMGAGYGGFLAILAGYVAMIAISRNRVCRMSGCFLDFAPLVAGIKTVSGGLGSPWVGTPNLSCSLLCFDHELKEFRRCIVGSLLLV